MMTDGNSTNAKNAKSVKREFYEGKRKLRGERVRLDILEVMPDTSIEIGDSDIFPLEKARAAGAGPMELYFTAVAPAAYGRGVDAKNAGDSDGGQHRARGFFFTRHVHQALPSTTTGSGLWPNQ